MPFSLIFAIPMSVLAAVFLVFSRMASDREIVAMKASGVSIWQIIQPPVVISVLLTLVCVYINCDLAPNSHYQRRLFLGKIGVETPLSLIDEGRFISDFPGLLLYVGNKDGFKLTDIVIYVFDERGWKRTIRAKSGIIMVDAKNRNKVRIVLQQVRLEQADEKNPGALAQHLSAEEYPLEVDMSEILGRSVIYKKRADLTFFELLRSIRGSVLLSAADLLDPDGLIRTLRQPEDRLAEWIHGQLSEATVNQLDLYDGTEKSRERLRPLLLEDLNALLRGPVLFDPDLFAGIKLAEATRERLARNPQGENLLVLNRMLLDDVYPAYFARNLISELNPDDLKAHRMSLMVEASTRLALSFSCFAFVLLGAALGVKIHRKESSIGILLALALVFMFYFFIIIADSMVSLPQYQPHMIVWLPFFLAETIGFIMIKRSN
jgi:lipopolysaccharide export LptBFGC system permease protein LptF